LRAFEQIATEPLPDELIEKAETAELVQMTLANIPANYKYVLKEYYYRLKPPQGDSCFRWVSARGRLR